ncbi:hypothetical protein [Zoogloea sp.]|uniref:hypothetical protein n=1 Tax=Zoogloea sp. TaxID=49181 RepID=UPI0026305E26|nr:hypothetical protein [Zoogloea sp.]MDD3354682.1 hypothetical protein [Zoogloea sp.]
MRIKPISTALHLALTAALIFGSGLKAPWLMLGLLVAAGLTLMLVIAGVFLRN